MPGSVKEDPELKSLLRTAKDLMQVCRIRREGAVVDVTAERKVEPDALAALFTVFAPL